MKVLAFSSISHLYTIFLIYTSRINLVTPFKFGSIYSSESVNHHFPSNVYYAFEAPAMTIPVCILHDGSLIVSEDGLGSGDL